MTLKAYLAGPDVFLPGAAAMAAAKVALCAEYGLTGIAPYNPNLDMSLPPEMLWRQIYEDDLTMMRGCDIIIANLTPFRGASADAGTLVELGWFLGAGETSLRLFQQRRGFCRPQPNADGAGAGPNARLSGRGFWPRR